MPSDSTNTVSPAMKLRRPLYSLSAFSTVESGPITPADLPTETGRTSPTSDSGIIAKDLMSSFLPALIRAVIDLTSETTNALLHMSITAEHALVYCAG